MFKARENLSFRLIFTVSGLSKSVPLSPRIVLSSKVIRFSIAYNYLVSLLF